MCTSGRKVLRRRVDRGPARRFGCTAAYGAPEWRSRVVAAVAVPATAMLIAGCGSHDDGDTISVLSAKAGDCFSAPTKVKAEVSDLDLVPCSSPHSQEAYALVNYARADDAGDGAGDDDDTYPGDQVLDEYAAGVCAQRFGVYVGVDYLDSSYYYTYLTPSPRSWQAKDRAVLCLITDAGKPMVGSVKGKGA